MQVGEGQPAYQQGSTRIDIGPIPTAPVLDQSVVAAVEKEYADFIKRNSEQPSSKQVVTTFEVGFGC